MIRFIVDLDNHETEISSSGSISDVVAEIGCCISIAYNMIRSSSPSAAEIFKQAMIYALLPDMPVWDKEDVPDPTDGVKIVKLKDLSKEVPHE